MAWRNCKASEQLLKEVNARWPRRDKRSDGTIGDPAHSNRTSDHNPNSRGVVLARDIDDDGILAAKLAERVRYLGSKGFRPLRGGYVIFNRRIAGSHTGWAWKTYTGENPHTTHIHVSFADAPADYDRVDSWGIRYIGVTATHSHSTPQIGYGAGLNSATGSAIVKDAQTHLRRKGYIVDVDGKFGMDTERAVIQLQHDKRLPQDGIIGPDTWKALHS